MRFKVFCLLMAVALGSAIAVAGEHKKADEQQGGTLCIPTGTFVPKIPASVEMEYPPVEFPHSVHFSVSCKDCHHKYTGSNEIKSCITSGCHDLATAPENPLAGGKYTKEAMKYYKYAYHEMCRPCHKELKKENVDISSLDDAKATGPTGCVECHPKAKTASHSSH